MGAVPRVSLHDRPTLRELLEAVRGYITDEVACVANDRRARFRALIAANVLALAERELASAADDDAAEEALFASLELREGTLDERRGELARRIRAGRYDQEPAHRAALAYARETVRRKLAVANPRFIERVVR
jgi:hypothetical protein